MMLLAIKNTRAMVAESEGRDAENPERVGFAADYLPSTCEIRSPLTAAHLTSGHRPSRRP
jgi:hypothetical protein